MTMNNDSADIFDSLKYVSRGGQKLAKALDCFGISPQGRICIDCGASTGGFTDCLLQRGARMVFAIDVGYGQLAWALRNDPRVKVMERTNIRHVTPDLLAQTGGTDEKPTLAAIDVSFISLSIVLPVIRNLMADTGCVEAAPKANSHTICLVKPQFEAGKGKVGKGGVVRDPETHEEVLTQFLEHAAASGFTVEGLSHSPVKGPKGNIEYLGFLTSAKEVGQTGSAGIDVKKVVAESYKELNR